MSINLNPGLAVLEIDGHHVEAAGSGEQPAARQVVSRHVDDALLLAADDRGRGAAIGAASPRLHLDEDQGLLLAGDDVNFSTPRAIPPRKNFVPAASQLRACEVLADFSKGLTSVV